MIDGEIVIARRRGPRLRGAAAAHPPGRLAGRACSPRQTPARFVAFDLLALGDEDLTGRPFAERRERLERALAGAAPPVHLTPATARRGSWRRAGSTVFEGAGLDGVIAKPLDGGVRAGQAGDVQDQARPHGRLRGRRLPLAQERPGGRLAAARAVRRGRPAAARRRGGGLPAWRGARSWSRSSSPTGCRTWRGHPWAGRAQGSEAPGCPAPRQPVEREEGPVLRRRCARELVVEVAYDHMEGARFRHTAQFRRWRPDRDPASCTYAQLERPVQLRPGGGAGRPVATGERLPVGG